MSKTKPNSTDMGVKFSPLKHSNKEGRATGNQTETAQLREQIPLCRERKNRGSYGGPL